MRLFCDSCCKPYRIDVQIPSEVWERISNGAYALCVDCIDDRLDKLGIQTAGRLCLNNEKGLSTERFGYCWRPIEIAGSSGHPEFFTDKTSRSQ